MVAVNLPEPDAYARNGADDRKPVWNWNNDPIRYDDPDAPISSGATTRERPAIRNVEDVWCWANTWGNERARDFSTRGERDAYRQCIRDVMVALAAAGIDFDAVPDEAWERWLRHRRFPQNGAASRLVIRCQDHPTYRGLSQPRACASCQVVHRLRGATTHLVGGQNTTYTARVGSA